MTNAKNVGRLDTAIRATVGSLLMVLAAVAADPHPLWALGAALVATAVLVTALAGVCPLYTVLGIDTHPRPRAHRGIPIGREPAHQLR